MIPLELQPHSVASRPLATVNSSTKLAMVIGTLLLLATMPATWLPPVSIGLGLVYLVIVVLNRISVPFLLKRLACVLPFVLCVLFFHYKSMGLQGSFHFLIRSTFSVATLVLFTATTPFPQILSSLKAFRVPRIFVSVLALAYRYMLLVQSELTNMHRSVNLRTSHLGHFERWRLYGRMMGSLFLKAFDRSERVHHAMLCRGFHGDMN